MCPQGGRLVFNRKRGRKIEVSDYRKIVKEQEKRLEQIVNKELLSKRKTIVEPIFAFIKENLSLKRFTLRRKENVSAQWYLACLIYNLRKIYRLGYT
ncbi:MAG: transposase [Candidatus Rifleibacteriota bacterium]